MSRRKNGTNRAASALGLNPYGWGNGGKRKRPKGVKPPFGEYIKPCTISISENGGDCK